MQKKQLQQELDRKDRAHKDQHTKLGALITATIFRRLLVEVRLLGGHPQRSRWLLFRSGNDVTSLELRSVINHRHEISFVTHSLNEDPERSRYPLLAIAIAEGKLAFDFLEGSAAITLLCSHTILHQRILAIHKSYQLFNAKTHLSFEQVLDSLLTAFLS